MLKNCLELLHLLGDPLLADEKHRLLIIGVERRARHGAAGLERTGGLVVYGLPRKSRDHVNSGEGGCGSMQGQQSLHQREASGREGNTDAFTPPGSINQSISNGEAGTSGPGTSKQGKWWSISPKRTARRGNNRHTVAAAIGRTPTAVARPIPTAQTAVTVLQPQPAAAQL